MQYHILIFGHVHGVFFRAFVKQHAIDLGINGWVMNTNNGVEILAQGSKEQLDKLVKLCNKGPHDASVDDVEVKETKKEKDYEDFKIVR